MLRVSFRSMGCQMEVLVDSNSLRAARLARQVPRWFSRWERRLSRFQPSSALSALNRNGRPTHVDRTFWSVLNAALAAAQLTDGLVTPTLLLPLEAAGYSQSFEKVGQSWLTEGGGFSAESVSGNDVADTIDRPSALAPTETDLAKLDWHGIRLDPKRRLVLLSVGMKLDFGGIAKGWAADRAARRLHAPGLVDAGGYIAVAGPLSDGSPWPIEVPAYDESAEPIATLLVRRGGVATSGTDFRRWRVAGHMRHHIIDPRTGVPAVTDVLRATVVGPSALVAEVAAKVVLLMGSAAGVDWIEQRPGLAAIVVREDGSVVKSGNVALHSA